MSSRVGQINSLLNNYGHLFKHSNFRDIIHANNNVIYAPYVPRDQPEMGIELKYGVGFVSIFEKIKESKPIDYTYKFFTREYECVTYRKTPEGDKNTCSYCFHYDKCENDIPHEPHVTVMYSDIRFHSRELSLENFLCFIQETFFKRDGTRKEGSIWHSRIS